MSEIKKNYVLLHKFFYYKLYNNTMIIANRIQLLFFNINKLEESVFLLKNKTKNYCILCVKRIKFIS